MGSEWDVRKLKSEIDREVKCVGLTEYVEERYGTKEYTKRKKRQYITGGMMVAWVVTFSSELGHSVWM